MGLDNIPHRHPCEAGGTAVRAPEGGVDCRAAQQAGGCPWVNTRLGEGAVYGPLGTDCRWRGEVGHRIVLTSEAAGAEPPGDLWCDVYGRNGRLTPEYCIALAEWPEEHGELYLSLVEPEEREKEAKTYRHMVRWLRWVAEHCDGADARF
ncbi:hypothetical protein [Thermomonospora catenispora]|uniref:hypothetical protein n=1 Tax=Thermomonospora catenispora TaxID=2493090 RepID=UPI001122A22E|nr:hypothetical protein [Thermomonospora catenispora]TNY35708.1 hypothetical protein EIO00_17350 [Thermomonospora catenispora]